MDNVIITGVSGYLGYCVEKILVQRGVCITQLTNRLENLSPKSINAKIVIHLAAALRHRKSEILKTNILGTMKLLKSFDYIEKIIFISSRAVYKPYRQPKLVKETDICLPVDIYGWSKLICENMIKNTGISYVILRSSSLYGYVPNCKTRNFINLIVRDAYKNRFIRVLGREQLVDTLYVWDLARLIADFSSIHNFEKITMNACGDIIPLKAIIDDIKEVFNDYSLPLSFKYEPSASKYAVILDKNCLERHMPDWKITPMKYTIRNLVKNTIKEL